MPAEGLPPGPHNPLTWLTELLLATFPAGNYHILSYPSVSTEMTFLAQTTAPHWFVFPSSS
jgi:hypothetical protein